MPFERRSDVQVLEYDRSDKCCNAQQTIAGVFTLLRLTKVAQASGM